MSSSSISPKAVGGNFFEDFSIGQVLRHATPRTVTDGDVALCIGLYGSRFAVQSSAAFAKSLGYASAPIDDLLVFHIVFGKSVPDISLNAIANLGYAECRFLRPVYSGDTLSAQSEVIGVRANSNGESGVVYVRTTGSNQRGETVLSYVRWVMVRRRRKVEPNSAAADLVPDLRSHVEVSQLGDALPSIAVDRYDFGLAGGKHGIRDYAQGEKIDHVDGVTVEEAEHQIATRLYQNTARVHFDQFAAQSGRFKRRLIYGGVVISLARSLSFNGLQNGFHLAAINGGRHVAPLFAGDTVFAWSEIKSVEPLPRQPQLGAMRVITTATKNLPCHNHPGRTDGGFTDGIILELDYWLVGPYQGA